MNIDVDALADALAQEQFDATFYNHGLDELYEDVDESGKLYLKPQYQDIFESLKKSYIHQILVYSLD